MHDVHPPSTDFLPDSHRSGFTIPSFRLPGFMAAIGQRLPQWPHSLGLVASLNMARTLGFLPEETLSELDGRIFRIVVTDTGAVATFRCEQGRFRPVFKLSRSPDLTFTASMSAYLQLMARQEDPDTLFFKRELMVEGDTELGLVVKNMLDAVEIPTVREAIARCLPWPGRS